MSESHGNMFLKLDGVTGEVLAKGFEGQIRVKSYVVAMSTGTRKSSTGNVTVTPMDLTLSGSNTHSALEYIAGNNKLLTKGTLTVTQHDGDSTHKPVKIIEFENIMVTSIQDCGIEDYANLDFPVTITYTGSAKENKMFKDDGTVSPTSKLQHKIREGTITK